MTVITKTTKTGLARAEATHDRALRELRNAERSFQDAETYRSEKAQEEFEARRLLLGLGRCLAAQNAKIEAKRAAARAEAAVKKAVK